MIDEKDLAAQLSDLDWGTPAAKPVSVPQVVTPEVDTGPVGGLAKTPLAEIDVSVPGVRARTPKVARIGKRSHHKAKPAPAAVPQGVTPATAVAEATRSRRPRDTEMDVLAKYGESPAVMALFESMWKEAGHRMALDIGRPKASKQDAAIGWYMFLEAMRQRDAKA